MDWTCLRTECQLQTSEDQQKSKREQTGGEELQEWAKKEKKKEKSDNEIRDGRRCKLCRVIDTDYDDVEPEGFIAWGYPPRNGCVQGTVCYYCRKVFSNIYSTRFKSLDDFGKEMTVQAHKEEFMEWRTFVISKYCEAGRLRFVMATRPRIRG